jgi:hypothetical protein
MILKWWLQSLNLRIGKSENEEANSCWSFAHKQYTCMFSVFRWLAGLIVAVWRECPGCRVLTVLKIFFFSFFQVEPQIWLNHVLKNKNMQGFDDYRQACTKRMFSEYRGYKRNTPECSRWHSLSEFISTSDSSRPNP